MADDENDATADASAGRPTQRSRQRVKTLFVVDADGEHVRTASGRKRVMRALPVQPSHRSAYDMKTIRRKIAEADAEVNRARELLAQNEQERVNLTLQRQALEERRQEIEDALPGTVPPMITAPNASKALSARRKELIANLMEGGPTPLDVLVNTMRHLYSKAHDPVTGEVVNEAYMLQAATVAERAAPYIHPRLANVNTKVGFAGVSGPGEDDGDGPAVKEITIRFVRPSAQIDAQRVREAQLALDHVP